MFNIEELEIPMEPLKRWRAMLEANTLGYSEIMSFLHNSASEFIHIEQKSSSELESYNFDEQGCKTTVIEVLEKFICGDNSQQIFEQLKLEGSVASVCGRVFKIGEPTYSCRECSMDPTCVLCSSCFKNSSHKSHKYKMSTSGGGGCCDCGDREAWKRDHFCQEHKGVINDKPKLSLVNEKMKQCCNVVFRGLLHYCIKTLQMFPDTNMVMFNEMEHEDLYCTILYNDETHTFEQVIQTLTSIVKCSQKEAIEYVTSIDREGRAVVKCSSFEICKKLKDDIENKVIRSSMVTKASPLKVTVLHKNEVACQHLAMYMLGWLQEFLTRHAVFRSVFCFIVGEIGGLYSLKQILSNDHKLWKSARTCWHRLLISGMLMEYESKKVLAIAFTKLYTNLMQDFIRDDHYHAYSIVSLSVQLFTVPTIAHYLIAHELAFFKLMHTFYAESIEKYVKNKQLQFPKNTSTMNVFKRAAYILIDVKYLLSFKPDIWTQELRTGFLHGVQILIRLFKCMQGMDAVTRQVGQHMEYEPEWETAFTLHLKLSHLITLVLEWCATDKVVLVKVYRMLLAALVDIKFIVAEARMEVRELADHSASCMMYDVASKPVSIHLPLTRFLAGLYIYLEKFELNYDNVAPFSTDKPTPEQIIEPVLCTRTMISQVYAGMWRRNGYSLLNQLYFYRNVKCRAEMLDRDILILQIGASLIESNEFLLHILNKFNLLEWTQDDFEPTNACNTSNPEEDNVRQVINMVDEFLELVIMIVAERFVPGVGIVTADDNIKKEIIQQLCIKPMSHSELNRALNEDLSSETGMESVILQIATFEKPSKSDHKGVYKLRPEYFSWFNIYFYHYSKEDKSKSEEAQRKRRKENDELICCPPPTLPKLSQAFSLIVNLLQCDVMLVIIQIILVRALNLKAITFSESHVQKVLHLIGIAIQEEDADHYPFLKFIERTEKIKLLALLEELARSPRVESQRDLLLWTIDRFNHLALKTRSKETCYGMLAKEPQPASITHIETEKLEKEERAKMAAKRRAQILAQMQNAQKSFISSNAELFECIGDDDSLTEKNMDWQSPSLDGESTIVGFTCCGPNRIVRKIEEMRHRCILCSEESIISNDGETMVYAAFVQKSSMLRFYRDQEGKAVQTVIHPSSHISTCGHVMHANCFEKYFNNEMIKENRRPYRNRTPVLFDIEKKEFLCPLCRFLSNTQLPLLPILSNFSNDNALKTFASTLHCEMRFIKWLEIMKELVQDAGRTGSLNQMALFMEYNCEQRNLDDEQGHQILAYEEFIAQHRSLLRTTNGSCFNINDYKPINMSDSYKNNIDKFCKTIYDTATPHIDACYKDIQQHIATWFSYAYTIESLEMFLRSTGKPISGELSIRHSSIISGFARVCSVLGSNLKQHESTMFEYWHDLFKQLLGLTRCSFLEWNLFQWMVLLMFSTRIILFGSDSLHGIPCGDVIDHNIITAIFIINVIKTIVTYRVDASLVLNTDLNNIKDSDVAENLLLVYKNFNVFKEDYKVCSEVVVGQLLQAIKDDSMVLLKCACLCINGLIDIELPTTVNFETLTLYLGLDANLLNYFKKDTCLGFILEFLSMNEAELSPWRTTDDDDRNKKLLSSRIFDTSSVRQLVELPDDYSDLINSVSLFTCPNNIRDDSRNPTMCLLCGEILCSQSFCCQKELDKMSVGSCTYHVHDCAAGVGIFLRIRDAEVLLLGMNKGCFIPAPYLDEYGETDQGLRRGNPLRLCRERYNKLQTIWLNHGIHEEIARRTESQQTLFATQWQNL